MDRLTTFDDAALLGASHRSAVSLIVESAIEIAEGTATSQIALVVGEPGGGKTRVIREVFEELCGHFDRHARYADVLPGSSLVAERDDSPVTMPFWWWPVDFANQETLHTLAGIEIAQRTSDRKENVDVVNFVRAAANWVPVVGQTLSIATLVLAARENLRAYTSRTSHSVELIVERLVTDLIRLAADRLVVIVIDDAELANAKTAPLIEALITTEHARVLILAAGDPITMSEQAVNYEDERTVASMCRRHHASSHPLAPLSGRELTELARTVGHNLGAADALAAAGGNPALLAAYLGKVPGDPFSPEDASRNRSWAELARRWPTVANGSKVKACGISISQDFEPNLRAHLVLPSVSALQRRRGVRARPGT